MQQILTNLLIAHVELRTEESPDIRAYAFERKIDKVVVPLGEELTAVRDKYLNVSLYFSVERWNLQGSQCQIE